VSAPIRAWKGHGTQNDFVVIEDVDGELDLSDGLVRALCDRRAGIGADGVLRVVRTTHVADAPESTLGAEYFMDYRNADASIAEMCGNGLRVFVRHLLDSGLVQTDPGEMVIGTRAGALRARVEPDGQITVDLGPPQFRAQAPPMPAAQPGHVVLMPNPHVVVDVEDTAELDALDLGGPPDVFPPLPSGQNVEFVVEAGDHHLIMRVHERGSGETRSCGTGIAAVVATRLARAPVDDASPWRVDVPGGTCTVRRTEDGHLWLTGPAVIVARIDLDPRWLAANSVPVRQPAAISG
jgi:diaminopimelate epimerase